MSDPILVKQHLDLKARLDRLRLELVRLEEADKFHTTRVAEIFRQQGVASIEELEKKAEESKSALKGAMDRWTDLLGQVESQLQSH